VSSLLAIVNAKSRIYGITRKYNSGHFWAWKKGRKRDRGKVKSVRIPLWAIIEFSKLLSCSARDAHSIMCIIEKGVVCYAGTGKSTPVFEPKLPLRLTPELVSIVFHLFGDGHIGRGVDVSHYRQINGFGLQNFIRKLHNSFGNFRETIVENSKIIVPRIITDFYRHYFGFNGCRWDTARIPRGVKVLRKEFLVAGLAAFIVDEGHISDHIELYSSNHNLLSDLREIVQRLGYTTTSIHPKYRYGILNGYRFLILKESAPLFYRDLKSLTQRFPTCGLVHKSARLEFMVKTKERGWRRKPHGVTKRRLIDLLRSPMTSQELSSQLNIPASSIREHLLQLQATNKVRRLGKKNKRSIVWVAAS
jgi:hypothetical protein